MTKKKKNKTSNTLTPRETGLLDHFSHDELLNYFMGAYQEEIIFLKEDIAFKKENIKLDPHNPFNSDIKKSNKNCLKQITLYKKVIVQIKQLKKTCKDNYV